MAAKMAAIFIENDRTPVKKLLKHVFRLVLGSNCYL